MHANFDSLTLINIHRFEHNDCFSAFRLFHDIGGALRKGHIVGDIETIIEWEPDGNIYSFGPRRAPIEKFGKRHNFPLIYHPAPIEFQIGTQRFPERFLVNEKPIDQPVIETHFAIEWLLNGCETLPQFDLLVDTYGCLLYTSPSPRDGLLSRMPSSA